ncbi:PAS domain S-box protein [Prosthecomicrobium sp. N25]|uniref:PAS domain S-box protein n=1 Tax=Prosthecomicrobium sp. N25 TaxID=3129254 RepID=UPI003078906F
MSPTTEPAETPNFLAAGGGVGALMRAHDWSGSPLGPPDGWPQSLRSVVGLLLHSKFPMFVAWGAELGFLYNDPYAEILGAKHPRALGRRFVEIWPEIWPDILPLIDAAMAGEAIYRENLPLRMNRRGRDEDTWFTFSYSPVRDETGKVAGMFCAVAETTAQVLAARRRDALLRLDERLRDVVNTADLSFVASELLGEALGASRVGYGAIDHDAGTTRVERSWFAPGYDDLAGLHRFSDYGSYLDDLRVGRIVANANVETDPRTAANAGSFQKLRIKAHLDVPVVENGRTVGQLFVHSPVPRVWADEEIAFVRDFAERTHAAIARRTAEQELRESEEFNRRILGASADCIKVLGLDARLEFMSEGGLCAMEVDDVASIRGALWPRFWDREGRARAQAAVDDAKRGGTGRFQGLAPTMKGNPRWWDVIVTPIAGPDGRPEKLLSVSRDMTATKQAEQALRVSEERLRTALTIETAGAIYFDMTGTLTDANDAFLKMSGYTRADLATGQVTWQRLTPPEHRHTSERAFAELKARGVTTPYEKEYVRKDGSRWWALFAAKLLPDGTGFEFVLDITDRKSAEARLRELNETLEAQVAARSAERDRLWNLSQDMLARADYSGMMSAVSPAWTHVLGWSEAELLSRGYGTFMHPDDMPPTLAAIATMAETMKPSRFENRIATKEGGFKHIEWTVAPESDGINFIAVGRDLSHSKAREAELEAAREALRQSQKMEAMGQLTGGVAHDFNNLLTPIVGALDMLQRNGLGDDRQQRLIAGAAQSADRAKLLVQRLLAFARRQPLQPVAVDITRLVRNMAELVASTTGPQIRVVVDAEPDLPPATADPNQLEMALLNLAVNARDAMPDGGTLRISAAADRIERDGGLELRPGRYIRLSVADTGAGMDEATLSRAVEPFFSTKGVGKGTGLGLSMVHGLASQLGGALTIASKLGLGTDIELWLPQAEAMPAEPPAPSDSASVRGRGKALIVDDEDLVRLSTADMLSELGYGVVEAASAEEALRLMGSGARVDLVVTDHLMPGLSGAELTRIIRDRSPGLPVLIVSGYAEADGIAPDLPRLTKPFRKDELALALAAVAKPHTAHE